MLLGHYGAAFALKRLESKVSLGVLFIAVQLVDVLWAGFVLLGWERARIAPGYTAANPIEFLYYPLTHSLLAAGCWALAAAAVYYSWPTTNTSRHGRRAAIVGLAVFSHYPLDVLMHAPDLPLAGNDSLKLGLGLWNSVAASVAAELIVFGAGIAVYVARRPKHRRVRAWRLAVLTTILLAVYFVSQFGPPPTSMHAVAISALVLYVVAAMLAAWAAPGGARRRY